MLRRLLNIASIVCLVLCVALMGMWVRSYYRNDGLGGLISPNQGLGLNSAQGKLLLVQQAHKDVLFTYSYKYAHPVPPLPTWWRPFGLWMFPFSRVNLILEVSYWFLVLTTGSLAMVLRIRRPWRFALRTSFMVTTFLAVVLGMIAWLDRAGIGK